MSKKTDDVLRVLAALDSRYSGDFDTHPGHPVVNYTDKVLLDAIRTLAVEVEALQKVNEESVTLEPVVERVEFKEGHDRWIWFGCCDMPSHGSGLYPVLLDGKLPRIRHWNEVTKFFDGLYVPTHFIDFKLPEITWAKGEEE